MYQLKFEVFSNINFFLNQKFANDFRNPDISAFNNSQMFSFTPRWTSLQKLYITAVTLCYSGQSKLLCATSDDAHMQTVDDATKLIDPGPGRSKGFEAGVEIASLLISMIKLFFISSVALVLAP